MALLHAIGFQDGMDLNNLDSRITTPQIYLPPNPITGEWDSANSAKLIYGPGRYPGVTSLSLAEGGIQANQRGYLDLALDNVSGLNDTLLVGLGVYISDASGLWSTTHNLIEFSRPGSTLYVNSIRISPDRSIYLEVPGLAYNTRQLSYNTWYYLEVRITFSNDSGSLEVRLDGSSEFTHSGDTSTQSNNNTMVGGLRFSPMGYRATVSPGALYISDIYVCDTTGSENNDFLGDVVVQTLRPNADGVLTEFLGSDGNQVDNFSLVNKANPDIASYVESANVGDRDLYNLSNLAIQGDVLGVQLKTATSKNGPGFGTLIPILKSDTSEVLGDPQALSIGGPNISPAQVFERDPDGLYWTEQSVNDLQVGVEVGDV